MKMRWVLILPFLLLFSGPAPAAPPQRTGIHQFISPLYREHLAPLLEQYRDSSRTSLDPAYATAAKAAVSKAAADFRAYLTIEENRRLVLADTQQGGALLTAVEFGLVEFVEALLAYPEFRATVDEPIERFGSLWAIASNAPLQGFIVCGDGHATGMTAGPLLAYLGIEKATSPYPKIRRLLEEAGATPRPDQARATWLKICDPSKLDGNYGPSENIPGSRDRVANAPDILDAILSEMETWVKERLKP